MLTIKNVIVFLILLLLLLLIFVQIFYWFEKLIKKIKINQAGAVGEQQVQSVLKKLNPKKYYILSNVLLKHPNNRTSQIDHIVISKKGIFVIETKNYAGILFGNVKDTYWLHKSGKNEHLVYNIALQNSGHIKAMQYNLNDLLLNLNKRKYIKVFVSIIALRDDCVFKIKKPLFFKRTKFKICNFKNLVKIIKKSRRRSIISKKLCKKLVAELLNKNINSNKNLKAHIKQINCVKKY